MEKARRRGAHRRKRPRRPLPGMLLHQDGSRHQWLAGQPMLDLIVTLDDATSAIYSAFLVQEEDAASTFRGLEEVFGRHGLPLCLYTDRGSHYFHTATAGGAVDRAAPTQVGRALAHLGVEHIAAYSPQVEAANLFLRDCLAPGPQRPFALKSEQHGSEFVGIAGINLGESLCVQEKRQVGNDSCRVVQPLQLQILASTLRAHFMKERVKVRQYPDGTPANLKISSANPSSRIRARKSRFCDFSDS